MNDTLNHCFGPSVLPPLPAEAYRDINIILASNSPRRRELLGFIVPSFAIAESLEIDESYPSDLKPEEVPAYLSRLKASAYARVTAPDSLLITADTVVILDGKVLGKPVDKKDAANMLRRLMGKSHTVVTGVTLTFESGRRMETFSESTKVTFGQVSDAEIDDYVDRYSPFDKAGAYGIQEWIGAVAITGIDGCFYNVMGLPLHSLYNHLRSFFDK